MILKMASKKFLQLAEDFKNKRITQDEFEKEIESLRVQQ